MARAQPARIVTTRDKSNAEQPWGCERPSKTLMWQDSGGRLFPVRCGASNKCWYCAYLAAVENAVVVRLDAELEAPNVGLTLTTVDPHHDLDRFRRDVEQVFRFIRRALGADVGYLGFMEWTTGRGTNSGGHRRVHQHALLKRADAAAATAIEPDLAELWKSPHRCEPGRAARVAHARGRDRLPRPSPPQARSGTTTCLSPQAPTPVEELLLATDRRTTRGSQDSLQGQADRGRGQASAGLRTAGGRARRGRSGLNSWPTRSTKRGGGPLPPRALSSSGVQHVPETFGSDGLPSTWTIEVLGPREVETPDWMRPEQACGRGVCR